MRQLLELDVLQDEIGTEPAIRLGERAPADVINLAYAKAPPLTSTAAVLAFDRSGSLPENAVPVPPTEKIMFVQEDGGHYYLADDAGQRALPGRDWLVTNVFFPLQQGGATSYLPLYYRATARFYHYEVNPPLLSGSSAQPYGGFGALNVYQGRHIRLLEHGEPVTLPHVINLKSRGANLWEVEVYLPWLDDPERRFTLAYHRSNPSGTDRRPHHTETLDLKPYFEEQFAARGGTITPGSNQPQFMTHVLPGGETYQIEVTEAPTTLSEAQHHPLAARVRVVATVGSEVYASPWRSVHLLDKPNVYDVLWGSKENPIFLDKGDLAARLVFAQAGPAVFGQEWTTKQATYQAELQVWNGTAWGTPDPNTDGVYPITSGSDPVLAYTTRSCGTPDQSPGRKILIHTPVTAILTIQGGANWTTPAVDKNACYPADTVYAQVAYPSGLDADLTDTNKDFTEKLVNRVFPPKTWSPSIDSRLDSGLYAYSAPIRQMSRPTAQTHTIRIAFKDADGNTPASYTLDDLTVTMGRYGELVAVRLVSPDNTTTPLALPAPQVITENSSIAQRRYVFTLTDFVAIGLELDVRPTVRLLREIVSWFLFFRIHWTNEWQKSLEIINVEAWERVPAQDQSWERQASIPLAVRRGMPERRPLRAVLADAALIPGSSVPTTSIRYGLTLSGASPPSAFPTISFYLTDGIAQPNNPGKVRTLLHPFLLPWVFWRNRIA